ncbi:helix-turn-helix transcriptional regulator [Metabacillus arenae]|uniref:Helix-turn-helix transcriptional regulator n=1 Tax=Metabacillus arenae TaxID=2771434 RepID=A0A926RV15_9BACI|nr:helix-turn-helix transcriptional regulator [Metabacillus arenae]MBD1379188.1 helix-turn-helix transcriptional regulator [Metabacillus arenae]
MGEKIIFEIELEKETVYEIEELIKYFKVRNLLTNMDFSKSHADFIKSGLYAHMERLKRFHSFTISKDTYKLKSVAKLQNKIKQYMVEEGLRATDLSELTEIDKGAISNILSNRNQPSMDYFLRIWIALGCPPIEELFYRDTD